MSLHRDSNFVNDFCAHEAALCQICAAERLSGLVTACEAMEENSLVWEAFPFSANDDY
jgi:hypothetical protein